MADHSEKIEADVKRVSKLTRSYLEKVYEAADEQERKNFRIDTMGVITVFVYDDDDGDTFEDIGGAFETKRHHAQTGILVDLLTARAANQ